MYIWYVFEFVFGIKWIKVRESEWGEAIVINAPIWFDVNTMVANTNGYLLHMFPKLPIKQLELKQTIKE